MHQEQIKVQIPEGSSVRIDKFIGTLGLFSRSQIVQRAVCVRNIAGSPLKLSRHIRNGDEITLEWDDPPLSDILPEEMVLNILYEDADCIVIAKDQGVVVHPAPGHYHGTLVQGLLFRYQDWSEQFDCEPVRPGIVHRLDKDTSGVIIVAKHPNALAHLSEEFRNRNVQKTYLAVTRGVPFPLESEIAHPIGRDPRNRKRFAVNTFHAKEAHSKYCVLAHSDFHALLNVRIFTGRTHQIRIHLKSIDTPVLGDPIYGRQDPKIPDATLMLHAWKLGITIPSGRTMLFQANIPSRFHDVAERLHLDGEFLKQ